jgi:hypothetical protein
VKRKRCKTCGDGSGSLSVGGADGITCWDKSCPTNMKKNRINSREKGKRGERQVCKLLTIGTRVAWCRTAQVRGKNDGAPDIEALTGFDRVWVEVKDRKGWTIGCPEWRKAWATCCAEAVAANKSPVLIWRASRGVWAATIAGIDSLVIDLITVTDPALAVCVVQSQA